MNNHGEIIDQGKKIHEIKALGVETVDIMRQANKDQYE